VLFWSWCRQVVLYWQHSEALYKDRCFNTNWRRTCSSSDCSGTLAMLTGAAVAVTVSSALNITLRLSYLQEWATENNTLKRSCVDDIVLVSQSTGPAVSLKFCTSPWWSAWSSDSKWQLLTELDTFDTRDMSVNPLTPTVVIWVQVWSILCQTGLSRHL